MRPRIDMHVHLAGVGTGESGCWISPAFRSRATFRALRFLHRITDEQLRTTVDADWAASIAGHVRRSELSHAVVLGFDGVYRGGEMDASLSQMVVPPSWVFAVCRRHPELLPGPSVNPHRPDAEERLEECIEGGAVLIKWLPSTQAIDPADPGLRPFYRRVAEAGIPLLIHAGGGERTFAEVAPGLNGVGRLQGPLEEGVTVVCAHSGTRVHLSRDPDESTQLRAMLERYPNLWVDNSGITNPSRFAHLPRLVDDELFRARTLHGSDFPVPTNALYYPRRLGLRRIWGLERIRNPLQRDVEIKRAMGYPEEVLTRPGEVLANVERWTKKGRS